MTVAGDRWLVCLFTFESPQFLENAVSSIDRFFPWGDRLVIDDGSRQPGVKRFLEELSQRDSRWSYIIMEGGPRTGFGGFYRNMSHALEAALEGGYRYCLFFEDDEQFVWHKADYPEYVEALFRGCPDAIQLQPLFARRVISYANWTEFVPSVRAYRTGRGFTTTGIWNLDLVRRHPDYRVICSEGVQGWRGSYLPANSAYWLKRDCRVYLQFDPTMAVLPWVRSRSQEPTSLDSPRGGRAEDALLLEALPPAAIGRLQGRPAWLPAYQEYFPLSRENVERPLWHQRGRNLARYYELCRSVVADEDRLRQSPARVSVLEKGAPSRIPPLQSHLDWRPPPRGNEDASDRLRLPQWGRTAAQWLLERGRVSLRDYLGFRELRRRLRREQRQFWGDAKLASAAGTAAPGKTGGAGAL